MDHLKQLLEISAGSPAGVSRQDYADVVQAVRLLPGTWSVERDVDDCDHTSVSIMQEGVPDADSLVFLVWREGGRYCVGLGQGDFYAGLGSHVGIDDAITAIRHVVEGAATVRNWMDELPFPHAEWRATAAAGIAAQAKAVRTLTAGVKAVLRLGGPWAERRAAETSPAGLCAAAYRWEGDCASPRR